MILYSHKGEAVSYLPTIGRNDARGEAFMQLAIDTARVANARGAR